MADNPTTRREWLVIESSRKNGLFASAEDRVPRGYIPRDVAEALLKRDLGGTVWFTAADTATLRSDPEWRTTLAEIDADCLVAENRERAEMWGMQ